MFILFHFSSHVGVTYNKQQETIPLKSFLAVTLTQKITQLVQKQLLARLRIPPCLVITQHLNMLLGMNWILTKAFYFLTLQLTDRNKKKMFSADATSGLSADSQGRY